jgi:hypothetical protein
MHVPSQRAAAIRIAVPWSRDALVAPARGRAVSKIFRITGAEPAWDAALAME